MPRHRPRRASRWPHRLGRVHLERGSDCRNEVWFVWRGGRGKVPQDGLRPKTDEPQLLTSRLLSASLELIHTVIWNTNEKRTPIKNPHENQSVRMQRLRTRYSSGLSNSSTADLVFDWSSSVASPRHSFCFASRVHRGTSSKVLLQGAGRIWSWSG